MSASSSNINFVFIQQSNQTAITVNCLKSMPLIWISAHINWNIQYNTANSIHVVLIQTALRLLISISSLQTENYTCLGSTYSNMQTLEYYFQIKLSINSNFWYININRNIFFNNIIKIKTFTCKYFL